MEEGGERAGQLNLCVETIYVVCINTTLFIRKNSDRPSFERKWVVGGRKHRKVCLIDLESPARFLLLDTKFSCR